MAATPDIKFVRCVEWTTERLFGIRPWISPTFIFQGQQCYLMLYFSRADVDETLTYRLYICGIQKLSLPFKVRILVDNVNFPSAISFPIATIKEQSDYIWKCSTYELCQRCQNIEYLCFSIIFYDDNKNTNTGDKNVQTVSYLNTDVSMESLSKDFSKLLDTGLNHDVEIKCGDQSLKVHKIVLCARSEVFKVMLQIDMREGRTGVMEIKDIDDRFIQDFIRYLYTDTLPELTFEKALTLYEVSDKYDVKSLMFRCSEYLQDNLSPVNACQCLAVAIAHSDQNLKGRVMTYILSKKVYLNDEHWLPFCDSYPKITNEVYRLSLKNVAQKKV